MDLGPLSSLAPELAKTFVSLASDIALVIDEAGVIRNVVVQGGADGVAPGADGWVGKRWVDTVTGDTRPKIEKLLRELTETGIARRREVNHPLGGDHCVLIAYTAIRLGDHGPVLAVGRDLRAITAIQDRYVESQQELERGYWQARQVESRYQLLFQVATDAVVVVDGETLTIVEANRAAAAMFELPAEALQGRHASAGFEHHSRGAVNELLRRACGTGASAEIRVRLQGIATSASLLATPFRTEGHMRLLMRLRALPSAPPSQALNETMSRLVDNTSDGVVVTDSSGRILLANRAFLSLARLSVEAQLTGQPLMNWLRLAGWPLAALMAKVRRDGIARHVESWVVAGGSLLEPIEISAALLTEGDQECIGFTMRSIGRFEVDPPAADHLLGGVPLHSLQAGINELALHLGEQNLDALVRAAAALAERHFAEVALHRHAGDIASAAAMLGLATERLQRTLRAPNGGA